ncbi:YciI family protein [Actinotalea sp. C106]|uniref:YciI family protein n=1 Tax=Actinotalea sp. C106 TaxID=2908644 RepID=UPI0020299359|nr:YciI family protein [Actinotalea sp. C106]
MTTYCVHYVYDDRAALRDEVRPRHRQYLRSLLATGDLLASGPWVGVAEPTTTPGGAQEAATPLPVPGAEQPGAMLVLRAEGPAAVAALLDADPFWVEGLVASRTLRAWDPVLGPWG